MTSPNAYTLVDPQNGNLAFKLFTFADNSHFDHIQRLNYYSMIWVQQGKGKVKADFSEYDFTAGTLFCFSPYQPFMFVTDEPVQGIVLNFHTDFFCLHKHQHEVACNGVLFNNIYQPPFITIDEQTAKSFTLLIDQIRTEMQNADLAQSELLVSYLKIFLITASRLKTRQQADALESVTTKEPFVLQHLKNYIEQHYRTHHSASDYAALLNITPKALAKITKTHFNKTLTNLISEHIVIEAKRELYLSNKSIKEIAYELGYGDEHYFSRFFKHNAGVSPQLFRETVGFARADN